MKELWDLAMSPAMLPLSILLVPVAIYWLFSILGAAGHGGHGHSHGGGHGHGGGGHHGHLGGHGHHGHPGGHGHGQGGAHHGHGHGHGHGHSHSHGHGHDNGGHHFFADLLQNAMRLMNAEEIPLMIPLTLVIVLLWGCAMLGNLWFAKAGGYADTLIPIGSLIAAVLLTRLVVIPLKPLFRLIQDDAEQEAPIQGRSGYVRTESVTPTGGQVVVENRGAPIIVGARTSPDAEPILRNTKVLIIGRDADTGIYIVRPLNEILPSV